MKTTQTQARYVEWFSAEEIHEASKEWLSELRFIKDEHLFFEDLITTFTSQLIASKKFSDISEVIDVINRSQKRNNQLIKAIEIHENELQIMIDGKDQLEEEKAYRKKHNTLIIEISEFLKTYKSLKKQLFGIIKAIQKEDKQRHIIDKN